MITEPQLRHYGVEIPVELQPRCPSCGGYCQLTCMMGDWFWICLEASRGLECDAPEIPVSGDDLAKLVKLYNDAEEGA